MTYDEAKRAAQAAADESGFDYGVEKLGEDPGRPGLRFVLPFMDRDRMVP